MAKRPTKPAQPKPNRPPDQRADDGRFASGNPGGPGGSRPGSGRRPDAVKQAERELWAALRAIPSGKRAGEMIAPIEAAVQRMFELIYSQDDKVAFSAAAKVLMRISGREPIRVDVDMNSDRTIASIDQRMIAEIAAAGAAAQRLLDKAKN